MQNSDKRLTRESLVIRILWMLLYFMAWQVVVPLLAIVVVLQLIYRLFKGQPHPQLVSWGDAFSQYLMQIGQFGVFKTEEKPWPVADWPASTAEQVDKTEE